MSWLAKELRRSRLLDLVVLVGIAVAIILVLVGPAAKTPKPAQTPQQQVVAKAPVAPSTKQQDSLPCPPPPGQGVMGACAPKPVQVYGSTGSAPPVVAPTTLDPSPSIPDVSSWQGNVDWSAVKRWQVSHGFKPAGIFKMGEFSIDPYAWSNNQNLKRLGMWRAGYWFLRRTGCANEANQIIAEARALGLKVVIEDDETPEAAGYDGCLTPRLKAAGLDVVEYASPGAYPGGSHTGNPAWMAAYGPSHPPASPWGGRIVAFQCTDGVYGCVQSVPGIGRGDMSVDYGITSLGAAPADPNYNPSFNLGFADCTGGALKAGYNARHHPKTVESGAFNAGCNSGFKNAKTRGQKARKRVPKPINAKSSFNFGFLEGDAAGQGGEERVAFGTLYATPTSKASATSGYQIGFKKAYTREFDAGYKG